MCLVIRTCKLVTQIFDNKIIHYIFGRCFDPTKTSVNLLISGLSFLWRCTITQQTKKVDNQVPGTVYCKYLGIVICFILVFVSHLRYNKDQRIKKKTSGKEIQSNLSIADMLYNRHLVIADTFLRNRLNHNQNLMEKILYSEHFHSIYLLKQTLFLSIASIFWARFAS